MALRGFALGRRAPEALGLPQPPALGVPSPFPLSCATMSAPEVSESTRSARPGHWIPVQLASGAPPAASWRASGLPGGASLSTHSRTLCPRCPQGQHQPGLCAPTPANPRETGAPVLAPHSTPTQRPGTDGGCGRAADNCHLLSAQVGKRHFRESGVFGGKEWGTQKACFPAASGYADLGSLHP